MLKYRNNGQKFICQFVNNGVRKPEYFSMTQHEAATKNAGFWYDHMRGLVLCEWVRAKKV